MTAFLDIAEAGQRGTTPFRGAQVDIQGLQARQIAQMLVNHPAVQGIIDGKQINLLQLVKLAPEAVAACIAYGTGYEDDVAYGGDKAKFDQACKRAATCSAGEQYDFLLAIFDVTFGERLNPFVKGLVARIESRVEGQATKVRSTKSVKELKDSLVSDTTPEMFGATHPGNSEASPA